jgi:hypothetical protein
VVLFYAFVANMGKNISISRIGRKGRNRRPDRLRSPRFCEEGPWVRHARSIVWREVAEAAWSWSHPLRERRRRLRFPRPNDIQLSHMSPGWHTGARRLFAFGRQRHPEENGMHCSAFVCNCVSGVVRVIPAAV